MCCFIADLNPDQATGRELLACCRVHGIKTSIDLAVLSSSDKSVLCGGSSEATSELAGAAQAAAKLVAQGWAQGITLSAETVFSTHAVGGLHPRGRSPHRPTRQA